MNDMKRPHIALILGSGPNVTIAKDWPKPDNLKVIAINNAWQVRSDWDYLVHAGDFPTNHRPTAIKSGQEVHTHTSYVAAQNHFGGFVYAGGTMAFTAGYWALHALKPDVLAYFGCDMTYKGANTHFYGKGTADPLRADKTLQSLEAKSARLMALADQQDCVCVNLSQAAESRLVFPRASLTELQDNNPSIQIDYDIVNAALQEEAGLGYFIEDGKYWKHLEKFDAKALSRIDDMWLATSNIKQAQKRFG